MSTELTYHDHRAASAVAQESETGSERGADLIALAGAAALGAAAMYFLDPDRGRRRRHLANDKLVHATNVATDAVQKTGRDVANRARGVGAAARRRFGSGNTTDDIVVIERVRAELGRVVSHPRAIHVTCDQGAVTLWGPVLTTEADRLVSSARRVHGVRDVLDRLERHDEPGDVPALQGGAGSDRQGRFELMQENWSPAVRLATTLTGGALAAAALREDQRRRPISTALGLAGLALFVRGATNVPFNRLVGAGAGRGAVHVQKSIAVAAPPDEVFTWLTQWERWPEWMSHVREVGTSGIRGGEGELTHWVVDGPAGVPVSWDAVTTRFIPNELVAWKTVDGSPVAHAGELRVSPTNDGFTRVEVQMSYNPVAGAAGHAVATLFGRDPKRQLNDDLARLKSTIETGRTPRDAAREADVTSETT